MVRRRSGIVNETDSLLWIVSWSLIGGVLKLSTPYLFVSLGECITERAGRINLGQEGALLLGAMVGYGASLHSGSPWLGVLAAGAAGLGIGALHAVLCHLPKVSDIAVGIALMMFGMGLAAYFGKSLIQPEAPQLPAIPIGGWSDDPLVQDALRINPLFLIGVALTPALAWFFRHTRWGLILSATGEHAETVRAMGHSVFRVRLLATMAGSFLAGIGGSFLSLFFPGIWSEGLSSGQGLIAVALVIFARWSPLACLGAALLFGAAASIGGTMQSLGWSYGYHLFSALPALITLVIMAVLYGRGSTIAGMPAELRNSLKK
jgi:ABC-type uncharacterized transport system permease subunit